MLLSLHVKNLALIDETEVSFEPGLNILSGETGAGKSIIIGSINLALGARTPKGMIRGNAEYALVELIFSVDQSCQVDALAALEIYPEEGNLIMSRKILSSGRSVCKINSETVSLSLMRKVASVLIDIHGQHEHQSLLEKKNHIKYLDAYASAELETYRDQLSSSFISFSKAKKALEEASIDSEQQARELSFLKFEIQEIENANLHLGEDEELDSEYKRLSHGRKILEAAGECSELCDAGVNNAADQIGRSVRVLLGVASYDEHIDNLVQQLSEVDNLLNDFNRELSEYVREFEFSDQLFSEIETRLDLINHLKSKYGSSMEMILEEKAKMEDRMEQLLHFDEYRSQLEEILSHEEEQVKKLSESISKIRHNQAAILETEIRKTLQDLNFINVKFYIDFSKIDHYTENGWDEVRFLISTNPGEPVKPLDEVASGGELSRIMLAIKSVLAKKDDIETLIFDEIDSGISGRTAQMVAEKIKQTSMDHQVICITHLPQIAAMADAHYLIEKTSNDESTISEIRLLDRQESINELARMLGGVSITETVLKNAYEMKELADSVRTDSLK